MGIAILVAVFAPLESLVQGERLTVLFFAATIVLVAVLFACGLLLEVFNS
jgi:hypothetical protein